MRAFDNQALPAVSNSDIECYIGIKFAKNYVGVVDELSFFLDYFDMAAINATLKFQGSNDAFVSEIIDLVVIGDEAHEGWNYYDMKELSAIPKYSAYRLFNENAKGCDDIGEIHFIGKEVLDITADDYVCEAEVV